MDPNKDAVSVRVGRLNSQLMNKPENTMEKTNILTREGLFDALQVLYDECNSECLKNRDKNIGAFVDKYRRTMMELKQIRVNITDFEVKNVIGRGHFGEVHVVKERQTGDVYAMKTVKKYENSEQKCAAYEEERNIMALATSPWITKLQHAFQDNTNLYFIMEYHPGGDLLGLLYRQGGTLPESAATFYIAELVVAINDVHQMNFVHRDIKPDNILLDRCGHLKLADFGSAVKLNSKGVVTSGGVPVGTPDYIAPEVLQCLDNKNSKSSPEYGKQCDYWSLGILAYELTVGMTPFNSNNTTSTYSKIMNHTKTLKFPSDILLTQAFISFIKGLLTDQNNRLGHSQIIKHNLFNSYDFAGLRDQVPPFVPIISSVDDTSNFSDIQSKKKLPNMDNFKTKTQFSGRHLPFIGFTYTTEPIDYKECYRNVMMVKDETVEEFKMEIENLKRKLFKTSDITQEKDGLEKKLEEKLRKLESVESVRDRLERDLANNISECQALKRTLELERKDRSDLERKALDLIKSAKLKWEASEKIKVDNLNRELDEYKEKNDKLINENNHLNCQLQEALQVTNKHKVSVENVEKLRRTSVMGLESRLEKVTSDTQNKLSTLQSQLNEETQARLKLQNKLSLIQETEISLKNQNDLLHKNCHELKSKCVESENTIKILKSDIISLEEQCEEAEQYRMIIEKLEEQVEDLKLDDEKHIEILKEAENSAVLKKQIKDLKGELNSMRASKLSSIEETKAKYERNLKDLEEQLRVVSGERNELKIKYQEAEMTLKNRVEKVNTLEQLLAKLQNELNKLENGSEREVVLQEQIERLEQQIVEVSENSAIEKQELAQLKSKYWRMEKDITNAELDKKIVERDLKEHQDKIKELQIEIAELNTNIENKKKTNESAVLELSKLNENLHEEISVLKDNIKSLEMKVENEKTKVLDTKKEVDSLKRCVESKELNICAVLNNLDDVKNEKGDLESRLKGVINQNDKLIVQLEDTRKENYTLNNALQKIQTEFDNTLLNHKALREACILLENQLIEFETILDISEEKREQLQTEISTLHKDLSGYKESLQATRKSANEEKSLRLLAETKVKRLRDDLENSLKEVDSYKRECEEFKSYSNVLSEDLTAAEQRITDYEITVKSYERQMDAYVTDSNYLKEENSEQLTFINSLKESNYKLGQNLSEAKTSLKILLERVTELETILNEKTQLYKERELKYEATIQQQTKLIDFLQSKVEEGNKKKKTLSDKLFGSSKKENVAPLSVALNYKDLELQLAREKEEKKKLQQEVIKLKAELYKSTETDIKADVIKKMQLQDEILSQIVQSPASQKNDLYRQNSVQRMHHNIPHRFESKLCTKTSKCAQCSNQILLGRSISVCRECHLITHNNCANSVPTTCGLPSAYAKHYSDSLTKLDGERNKNNEENRLEPEKINVEGWVKIPKGNNGWEKHYACLTSSYFNIYNEPPNNQKVEPISSLKLHPIDGHGKVVLEPLASEIEVPVASSDLPFVMKVETTPNSTCWPSQCLIFMTLSIEDKERWFKSLHSIFYNNDKYSGETVFQNTDDLEINCIVVLDKETQILGTETGLYALQKNKLLHILGPLQVFDIIVLPSISTALMIVDECRVLISCDLKHLISLSECSAITKPTLKFKTVNINNLDGFHIIKASHFEKYKNICIATPKQLIVLKYDFTRKEILPQRILDTAQPVSCVLFTEHSLIIGADKFFEVDLNTFEADEFLDASDEKLRHAVKCYSVKSFPLAILQVSKAPNPVEYLVCFNEFATFVDEYGRSTRANDINWSHLPTSFYFNSPYLYVIQFNAVEIFKITPQTCNTIPPLTMKIDFVNPQHIGNSDRAIFVMSNKRICHLNANILDDDASTILTDNGEKDEVLTNSDRFSFTSSMMQSLDGNLSDNESDSTDENMQNNRRVKFVDSTDL